MQISDNLISCRGYNAHTIFNLFVYHFRLLHHMCQKLDFLKEQLKVRIRLYYQHIYIYIYYTSVVIFYIKISLIVLLFFQAYVEKFTSPVNSFQLFDRHCHIVSWNFNAVYELVTWLYYYIRN